jgi:hypothetical protein
MFRDQPITYCYIETYSFSLEFAYVVEQLGDETIMRVLATIAAFATAFAVVPASATTLLAGSGWQDDTATSPGIPSNGSTWDFTLTGNGLFSVTDAFLTGDVYTLSGGATGSTTFYAGSAMDVQADGYYGTAWTNAGYSKIAVSLLAGTYSVSIAGDCTAGCPAGFAVRLDEVTTSAVPESSTWAMMLVGFGGIGFAVRRRPSVKTSVHFA